MLSPRVKNRLIIDNRSLEGVLLVSAIGELKLRKYCGGVEFNNDAFDMELKSEIDELLEV